MLTNIKLKNFKCFEQLDLECRPLNLLCGLNGTGKSSVLQALLVLRQSSETGKLRDGELVLGGERIDLGTGEDVLLEDTEDGVVGFTLQDDRTAAAWNLEFDSLSEFTPTGLVRTGISSGHIDQLLSRFDSAEGDTRTAIRKELEQLLALLDSTEGPARTVTRKYLKRLLTLLNKVAMPTLRTLRNNLMRLLALLDSVEGPTHAASGEFPEWLKILFDDSDESTRAVIRKILEQQLRWWDDSYRDRLVLPGFSEEPTEEERAESRAIRENYEQLIAALSATEGPTGENLERLLALFDGPGAFDLEWLQLEILLAGDKGPTRAAIMDGLERLIAVPDSIESRTRTNVEAILMRMREVLDSAVRHSREEEAVAETVSTGNAAAAIERWLDDLLFSKSSRREIRDNLKRLIVVLGANERLTEKERTTIRQWLMSIPSVGEGMVSEDHLTYSEALEPIIDVGTGVMNAEHLTIRRRLMTLLFSDGEPPIDPMPAEWRKVPPFGGELVYVSAERLGPQKLYPRSVMKAWSSDFGASSEYAWSYLHHQQDNITLDANDPRLVGLNRERMGKQWFGPMLTRIVNQWLQEVSPGVRLQLEDVAAADALIAGFSFDRPGNSRTRPYRATNVGFGLSYVLPVVLALLAEPGTLCLIENPESHLHPRGQTKLGELAARAAKAGVQVFVETHSDHFMDGVRIAVRDGLIAPEDVAFHYFERQDGKAVVSSPQVDADGRLSEWPAGFFDQHGENLARLLAPRS